MKLHAVLYDSLHNSRRLVIVDLTDQQAEALRPRVTGKRNGKEWYQELAGPVWLERDDNLIEGGET